MKYSCIRRYVRKYRNDGSYKALDGGWGWIIVLCATINHASFGYIASLFSVLFYKKLQDIEAGSTGASMIINTLSVMVGVSGLISGPLIKYVSYQVSAMTGGIIAFLGYLTAYFATELWHLIIGIGVLVGIGAGTILNSNIIAVNNYFDIKKSWAIGLAFSGGTVSQIVMPYIITAMLQTNGYGGTVLMIGGICLNSTVASLLFHPLCDHSKIRKNQDIDLEQMVPLAGKDTQKTNNENSKRKTCVLQKIKDFFDLDILVNPVFINITGLVSFIFTANLNCNLLIPLYLKDEVGLPFQGIATYISVRASGDLFCRVVISWIMSKLRMTARFSVWISAAILILSRLGITSVSNMNVVYPLAFVEGIGRGIFMPHQSLCFSEEFRHDKLPNAIGLSAFLRIFAQFLIGGLVGEKRLYTSTTEWRRTGGGSILQGTMMANNFRTLAADYVHPFNPSNNSVMFQPDNTSRHVARSVME